MPQAPADRDPRLAVRREADAPQLTARRELRAAEPPVDRAPRLAARRALRAAEPPAARAERLDARRDADAGAAGAEPDAVRAAALAERRDRAARSAVLRARNAALLMVAPGVPDLDRPPPLDWAPGGLPRARHAMPLAAARYFQTPSCVLLKSRVLRCVALRVRLSELCARVPLPLWERDFYENGGPPCKLACVSAAEPSHPTRALLLLLLRVLRLPLWLLLVLLLLLPCTAAAAACPAPHPARVAAAAAAAARAAAAAGTTGARAPKRRVVVDETEEAAPATPSKLSHAGRNA